MNLKSLIITPDAGSVSFELTSELQQQFINTAEFFELTNTMPLVKHLAGSSYDVVMWFTHDNGQRYGVITTTFGQNYKDIFKTSAINWVASVSTTTFKRECVKDYLDRHNCNTSIVYCILEGFESDSDEDY